MLRTQARADLISFKGGIKEHRYGFSPLKSHTGFLAGYCLHLVKQSVAALWGTKFRAHKQKPEDPQRLSRSLMMLWAWAQGWRSVWNQIICGLISFPPNFVDWKHSRFQSSVVCGGTCL